MTFNKNLLEHLAWSSVPTIAVEFYRQHQDQLEKEAQEGSNSLLRQLSTLWQIRPGTTLGVPNVPALGGPGPLASMLVGGLIGAGLGRGTGWLASRLFPERWDRKKLMRNSTLAGAALGALPGLGMTAFNMLNTQQPTPAAPNPWPIRHDWWRAPLENPFKAIPEAAYYAPHKALRGELADPIGPAGIGWLKSSAAKELREKVKVAFQDQEYSTGIIGMPAIDVNEFNQVIWKDPRVARPLPTPIQAAASGLVTGAANLPGKRTSRFVTPMDIGRVAAGMGAGYLSGVVVGKTLGALMGMPTETQDRMKNVGLWAGVVNALVPTVFGE